jgi:hypothetical protein
MDDDMLPRTEWLAYCVDYSRTNGHGLVGANGRTFERFDLGKNKFIQRQYTGKNPLACKQCEICHEIVDFYLKLYVVVQYQDAALGTFVLLPMHLHRSHFERRQSYLVSNINKRNKNKVFPYGDGNAAERICNILLTKKLPTASIAIRPIVNKSNTIIFL